MSDEHQTKPARRGRPPTNPGKRHRTVTFSLPPSYILWINQQTQARGLKRSVYMRGLIEAEMAREAERQEAEGAERGRGGEDAE